MSDMPESGRQETCAGCGVRLQTADAGKIGYIPVQALERQPTVCQRCFRIKHYNEISPIAVNSDEFLKMIGNVAYTDALVVNIVDLFDFEGSLMSGLPRFVGNNPVVLAVNKIDLLPKSVNLNRVRNWAQKQAKEQGLKTVDVVLCSAKKNIGFEHVIESIGRHRRGRDVYVVGATNVGKSTLINRLIRDHSDLDAELTTSPYPGTTLDVVKIPLDDGKFIIDTPGIVYRHRLSEVVAKRDLGVILPEKEIKPIVYQLNERQTLFFGALARFDFVKGSSQSFACYMSNALNIHRTKLERADELYEQHKGELLKPPDKDHLDRLPPLIRHSLRIPRGAQKDVLVSGLGWIKVNGDTGADVELYAPQGIKVVVRDSLI